MRFDYSISHFPGKNLTTADTLSRSPVSQPSPGDEQFQQEVKAFLDVIVRNVPATEKRLQDIQSEQDKDATCRQLKQFCRYGWPNKSDMKGPLKLYAQVMDELSVHRGLLLRGSRLVVPSSLRSEILQKLHFGHLGITKCHERAKQSVWWPGIRKELDDIISKCPVCCRHQLQPAEPLLPTAFPEHPWQRVSSDLFEWEKSKYLLVTDYYSRYIEVTELKTQTSREVINHLKSIFARHGIPEILVSDNGTQYSSTLFREFATEYGFTHLTSSPNYPQGNGAAERAVKTVKGLLRKKEDQYVALLAHRSTPLENGYSPAELLMGRELRTIIPVTTPQLHPRLPKFSELKNKEKRIKERQCVNFNTRHHAKDLKPFQSGDAVWLPE